MRAIAITTITLAAALLAACFTDADDPNAAADDHPGVAFSGPLEGREHQGRRLLGLGVDGLAGRVPREHVTVDLATATLAGAPVSLTTASGSLTMTDASGHTSAGIATAMLGVIVTASDGAQVRLDSSAPMTSVTGPFVDYTWSRRATGGMWAPLCADGGAAVTIAGHFDRNGDFAAGATTLACADGVARKCVGWGYSPWASASFLPCTRMARADYCMKGITHTFNGTEIVFWDADPSTLYTLPPMPRSLAPTPPMLPLSPAATYFEAGWRATDGKAMCLSKLRWQALPLGGPCPDVLPDPRTWNEGNSGATPHFCEDLPSPQIDALVAEGAILFDESHYNDIGFYRWSNGARWYTTSRGSYLGTAGATTAPALGYDTPVWEGTIYTLPDVGRAPLTSYRHWLRGDFVTTTLPPPAGYTTTVGVDGYLATTANPFTMPVYLYVNPSGPRYLTSADPPPVGFGAPVLLGHLLRP